MDAGLAAVCGALAGAVATTGAAFATGWWQRENVLIAARAEHRRQRREPRSDVYKTFVAAVVETRDAAGAGPMGDGITISQFGPERFTRDYATQINERVNRVREAWLNVAISGPDDLAALATSMDDKCAGLAFTSALLVSSAERLTEDQPTSESFEYHSRKFSEDAHNLTPLLTQFMARAREVLDEDGTVSRD